MPAGLSPRLPWGIGGGGVRFWCGLLVLAVLCWLLMTWDISLATHSPPVLLGGIHPGTIWIRPSFAHLYILSEIACDGYVIYSSIDLHVLMLLAALRSYVKWWDV